MAGAGSENDHDPGITFLAGFSMADRSVGWQFFRSTGQGATLAFVLLVPNLPAQSGSTPARAGAIPPPGRALIVVGLPGDSEHETLFRETVKTWREWLTGPLKFPRDSVHILFGAGGDAELGREPATRESIRREVDKIRSTLAAEGRLWVLFLGHANLREGHAFFHLPGPDLSDDECAAMFTGIRCREQVFWITTAASGAFLPGLSAPGRIVITATMAGQETIETEFPHALAEVCRMEPRELDRDGDGTISVWEIFLRTTEAVDARFQKDQRAPTEHALLDDNGDRQGTERPEQGRRAAKAGETDDGTRARQTVIFRLGVDRSP